MKDLIHSYINEEAEFTGVESPLPLFFLESMKLKFVQ